MTFAARQILAAVCLCLCAGVAFAASAPEVLRVGYLKSGALLVTKALGGLEQRLGPQRIEVQWVQFGSTPELMSALNSGAIDVGAGGSAAGVFAQAANNGFVYIGYSSGRGSNMALLVKADAPIRSVADLKGKSVAFTRGSSAHWFVVKLLERARLEYSAITPVFLSPADALAAFASGRVDAWAIWDPYCAIAQQKLATRVVQTAEGLAPGDSIFVASKPFVARRPDLVPQILDEIGKAAAWSRAHPQEFSKLLASQTGIDLAAAKVVASRSSLGIQQPSDANIHHQQEIANTFYRLKLIPRPVDVSLAIWRPAHVSQ